MYWSIMGVLIVKQWDGIILLVARLNIQRHDCGVWMSESGTTLFYT